MRDISKLLNEEFKKRKASNRSYSLRAFSRDLKVSSGFLSEVLSGKKRVSVDKAMALSRTLGWSWRDTQIFLQTAQLDSATSKHARRFIKSEIKKTELQYGIFRNLKIQHFSPISNWYYFAIIEMTELAGFSDDPSWIANELQLDVQTATSALQYLKHYKYIYKNSKGRWIKNSNNAVKDVPSSEIRKFHRQHLMNAERAIENQSFDKRHFSGITLAIDSKNIPKAINLITEFRSKMSVLMETETKNSLYHLAVQFFQLDGQNQKREQK